MAFFSSLQNIADGVIESEIIKEVKEYELLWKTSPKGSQASKKASNAWSAVQTKLQNKFGLEIPLLFIRRKWKYLRDHYIRQRKHVLKKRAILGIKQPEECKWKHYKELKFLNKADIKSRSSTQIIPQIYFEHITSFNENDHSEDDIIQTNVNTIGTDYSDPSQQQYTLQYADSSESVHSKKEVQLQLNFQNPNPELSTEQYQQNESIIIPIIQTDQLQRLQGQQSSNAIILKTNQNSQQTQFIEPSIKHVQNSNRNQSMELLDENDLFAEYISKSLKQIDPKLASQAKLKIQEILTKFEQESYNNPLPTSLEVTQQPQISNNVQTKFSRNHYTDNYVIRPLDSYNNGQYPRVLCENGKDSTNEIEVIAIDDDIKSEDM